MTDNKNKRAYNVLEDTRRLAELAGIPEPSFGRFCELLEGILWEAYFADLYLGRAAASERLRSDDIKEDYLDRIAAAARSLDELLAAALLGDDVRAAVAGSLLEATFATGATAIEPLLPTYRTGLAKLIGGADIAGKLADGRFPPRRKRGHPGDSSLPFENFVKRLYEIAEMTGGHLPLWGFKTMIQILDLLRPYLPESGFFPKGDLGLWLERRAKEQAKNQLMH